MQYTINFNNGLVERHDFINPEAAKDFAEFKLSYTQQDVKVTDERGNESILPWYGVTPDDDDVVTAQFGNYGFYGQWIN